MKTISNCLSMYKNIWKVSKLRIILIFILSSSDAINMIITTFFFKFAIDALLNERFDMFLLIIAIRIGFLLIYQCFDNFFNTVIFPVLDNKIRKEINLKMYEKIKKIDLYTTEKTEFYDMYNKAINEADNRAIGMLNTLRGLLSIVLQATAMFASLIYLSPITIIIAIIGTVVTLWGNVINTKKVFNYENKKMSIYRFIDYIRRVYYLPQYAKDIRTTNISNILKTKYSQETCRLNEIIKKDAKSIAIISIAASWLFNVVTLGISSVFIGYKIYKKIMSVGDFVTSINAISNLSANILMFLNIIPEFKQHSLFIDNYLAIINYNSPMYNEITKNYIHDNISSIVLNNVSFSYTNKPNVLKNININITANEKIAFVGENGAGKSTLLKLIIRLYDPSSGELLINNMPYKQINPNELYNNISAIFQDFQCYAFNLKDNILLDNEEIDKNKLNLAIENAGLKSLYDNMDKGFYTNITTEFYSDGVNLSGGQYQKIAIARALYNNKPIVIMDEPTSALDPIAEKELFDIIEKSTKDKTLIVVSHRLSLVKNMDKIFYIKNGEILEEGNHATLMKLNGEYAKMFTIQAERYGL